MYVREMTQKIRESDPTLPNTQRMQRIHVQWKKLTPEEHAHYQTLADEANKANAESKAAAAPVVAAVVVAAPVVATKAAAAPKVAKVVAKKATKIKATPVKVITKMAKKAAPTPKGKGGPCGGQGHQEGPYAAGRCESSQKAAVAERES